MYIKNRDYVYYRELLLGLRGKYQSLQKDINSIINDYINDSNYSAFIKKNNDETCMYFKDNKEKKMILKVFKELLKLNNSECESTLISYGYDNKKNFVCFDKMDEMDAGTLNDFFNVVDLLLNSEFVSNTSDKELFIEESNGDLFDFAISPSGIMLAADKCNNNAGGVILSYGASSDRVLVSPYSMTLMPYIKEGGLQSMLDSKIPYEALNPYLINEIKGNTETNMSLEFEEDITDVYKNNYFDFVKDESKGIMQLKRVK